MTPQKDRRDAVLFIAQKGGGMNSYQAGQKLLCGGYTAYTPEGKTYFVRAGRWYKDPLPGDWV